MKGRKRLAIIGGGLGGMISARVARSSNLYSKIRVFERDSNYGGNWNPAQTTSRTGVYRDLKTNLPTILMGDPTFPWNNEWRSESFPHHTEFRNYFRMYWNEALDEETRRSFRFNTEVLNVDDKYRVTTSSDNSIKTEEFDQIIVATGHFDLPFVPPPFDSLYKDQSLRDETVFHSKNWDNYRDRLENRDVVLVGFGPSALDLGGFLSESARSLHWVHHSFHDLPENANDSKVKFWSQIQDDDMNNTIRLSRKNESEKLCVANNLDENNVAVIFATGYKYNHSFLDPSLRPRRSNCEIEGGKTGVPTENLACNFILRPGEVAFIGMANVVVPSTLMYYQALSFVNWDSEYYQNLLESTKTNSDDRQKLWNLVQSEFLKFETFQLSGLHYRQQAYCDSLLKTLCRAHEESSLLSSSLRSESDLMLSRAQSCWRHQKDVMDGEKTKNIVADYVRRAVQDARFGEKNKLSSGPRVLSPYRESFESDLLCAYEIYRCVSEMRAERRLGAFDASKVSTSSDVLTALTRKDYAAACFDRHGVRDWSVSGGVGMMHDNEGEDEGDGMYL
jgi:thioredoxin reductase